MAELLMKEWLLQWKYKDKPYKVVVSPRAQFIQKVENLERDLIEVIKYGSNIFTEPDIRKKSKNSKDNKNSLPPMIYVKALDSIFKAMRRKLGSGLICLSRRNLNMILR